MWEDIKTVVRENYDNRYRTVRLANYELRSQTGGTMFGFLWNFLNPALQIFIYWFVFAIGLRSAAPKGEYSYLMWMVSGIIPWFYISSCLMASTMSIYNYRSILKRMYLPLSVVPVKTVLSNFIGHLWAMVVVLALFLFSGYRPTIHSLYLFYFMFCSVVFLIGFSFFASAITVLFKDFQQIMNSIIRLLFYITPVVWVQDDLDEKIRFVLNLNPLAYIVKGYRDSMLYQPSLMDNWKQMIYFWVVTIILLLLGIHTHMKFREEFMDLI